MPQVGLERSRVDAVIRQLKAAGVAQHVRDQALWPPACLISLRSRLTTSF
jgi:hypothetical protein